jgi:hypothetical protein
MGKLSRIKTLGDGWYSVDYMEYRKVKARLFDNIRYARMFNSRLVIKKIRKLVII